jgi:hypothetical protein
MLRAANSPWISDHNIDIPPRRVQRVHLAQPLVQELTRPHTRARYSLTFGAALAAALLMTDEEPVTDGGPPRVCVLSSPVERSSEVFVVDDGVAVGGPALVRWCVARGRLWVDGGGWGGWAGCRRY